MQVYVYKYTYTSICICIRICLFTYTYVDTHTPKYTDNYESVPFLGFPMLELNAYFAYPAPKDSDSVLLAVIGLRRI